MFSKFTEMRGPASTYKGAGSKVEWMGGGEAVDERKLLAPVSVCLGPPVHCNVL